MRRTPSYLDGTTVAVSNTQNHRKNIIFSLVAALVVALLAACGQSTPGAEPQDLPEQPQLEDVATLEWNSVAIGYEADAAPIELSGLDEAVELIGSGADIWGTSDEFFFTFTTLEGDGALTVRLDELSASDGWSKAGVMIRDGLDADAANALLHISQGNGSVFQARTAKGERTVNSAGSEPGAKAPSWIRLDRKSVV